MTPDPRSIHLKTPLNRTLPVRSPAAAWAGWEIHLVDTLMEAVSYSRGDGRNNLTMVANRTK